jgi:hypothetical protein
MASDADGAMRQFDDVRRGASKRHAAVIAHSCSVASMSRHGNPEESR